MPDGLVALVLALLFAPFTDAPLADLRPLGPLAARLPLLVPRPGPRPRP